MQNLQNMRLRTCWFSRTEHWLLTTERSRLLIRGEIANNRLHVFECNVDGQTKYILPVYGAGLWGPVWGYIALDQDKDTVYGVYFSHAGETPGLGAEITTVKFQDQFLGKHVLETVL